MVTSNALPKMVRLTNDSDIGDGKSDEIQCARDETDSEGGDSDRVTSFNLQAWRWKDPLTDAEVAPQDLSFRRPVPNGTCEEWTACHQHHDGQKLYRTTSVYDGKTLLKTLPYMRRGLITSPRIPCCVQRS